MGHPVEVERFERLGWVETFGVLRCAQDDSKDKQTQDGGGGRFRCRWIGVGHIGAPWGERFELKKGK
jgi:hypothetical protein